MNKYEKWYNALIEKALTRNWTKKSAGCYVEQHHIKPRSLNGSDDKSNLVCLTAREHFVAHAFLCRFGDINQQRRMTNALTRFMSSNKTISSVMYDNCKKRYSKLISERLKGNKYRLGKVDSEETRKKKSVPGKGGTWKRKPEHCVQCSDRIREINLKNNPMNNPEARAKVGASKIGRKIVINKVTGERKFAHPDNIPVGFSLKE